MFTLFCVMFLFRENSIFHNVMTKASFFSSFLFFPLSKTWKGFPCQRHSSTVNNKIKFIYLSCILGCTKAHRHGHLLEDQSIIFPNNSNSFALWLKGFSKILKHIVLSYKSKFGNDRGLKLMFYINQKDIITSTFY